MTDGVTSDRGNAAETQQARVDLAAVFRMTARLNMHEGVCNHISVMLPGRRFLINPKGVAFERITAGGLLVIDEHGTTVGRAGAGADDRLHDPHPGAPEPPEGEGRHAPARALFDGDHRHQGRPAADGASERGALLRRRRL